MAKKQKEAKEKGFQMNMIITTAGGNLIDLNNV